MQQQPLGGFLGTATSRGFHLEESEDGVSLVVTGPWSKQAEQVLRSGNADALDLNYAKGFKDTDLRFIGNWPLRRVNILARTIKDLSPLYRLSGSLEYLSIDTSPTAVIDLSRMPVLHGLSAGWAQVRDSIRDARGLRELFLRNYTEDNLEPLRWNSQLERLRFKDHPRLQSLDGLEALQSIRHLGVYLAARLEDIDALRELEPCHLEELHLESCRRVSDLGPVSRGHALRLLNASDCDDIESLHPLADLMQLEVLWLYGTTRILDGDLSPVLTLPRLHELRIQSRRSYSPSSAQVKSSIAKRKL